MLKWFKEFLLALKGGSKTTPSVTPPPQPQPPVKTSLARDLFLYDINNMLNDWYVSQVGVKENGWNKGKEVELYQKTVDGVSEQEAWCMSFMQTGLLEVAKKLQVYPDLKHMTAKDLYKAIPIHKSESCMSVFTKTNKKYVREFTNLDSLLGFEHQCWFIQQQFADPNKGHTGKVFETMDVEFSTVEGNTNGEGSSEGDGVYKKMRPFGNTKDKKLRGFVNVTAAIYDMIQGNSKV
jgi:hypothetical protein